MTRPTKERDALRADLSMLDKLHKVECRELVQILQLVRSESAEPDICKLIDKALKGYE